MVTPPTVRSLLESEIRELLEDYEAKTAKISLVRQQIREALDLDQREALAHKRERLEEERRAIREQMRVRQIELDSMDTDDAELIPSDRELVTSVQLARLDFVKQCEGFTCWVLPYRYNRKATMFAVEGGLNYGCDLLVRRFVQDLQRDFPSIEVREIAFPTAMVPGVSDLESFLGRSVALESNGDLEDILHGFEGLMCNCHFLFLVIHRFDSLLPASQALAWLLDGFWKNLLEIAQGLDKQVYLSLMMVCYQDLPSEILEARFDSSLSHSDYDGTAIICLPELSNFTREDISSWLSVFFGLKGKKLSMAADRILKETQGHPLSVYETLKREAVHYVKRGGR